MVWVDLVKLCSREAQATDSVIQRRISVTVSDGRQASLTKKGSNVHVHRLFLLPDRQDI